MRLPRRLILCACAVPALAAAPAAIASPTASGAPTGGTGLAGPKSPKSTIAHPTVVGDVARIVKGMAYAPSYAPAAVKRAIWAGNKIRHRPYVYSGGHGSFKSRGYDCSGSVSFVLHAAGLLKVPEDSSDLAHWGVRGPGQWITVYTNPNHAFVEIAGVRFDTSAADDPDPAPGSGPRWRPLREGTRGYMARHPAGY